MRAAAQLLLGVLGLVVITPWAADAASISGTVTGPDGAPLRAAFVQARHGKLKIVVACSPTGPGSIAWRTCRRASIA